MDELKNLEDVTDPELKSALSKGDIDTAKLLVQSGAKLGIPFALGDAVYKQKPEVVEFLLANCDSETLEYCIELTNAFLLAAVKSSNLNIIRQLLDAGAIINKPFSLDGTKDTSAIDLTPLMVCKTGEVAQFLIQRGADVNQILRSGFGRGTALTYILNMPQTDNSYKLDVVQVLLQNKASTSYLFSDRPALVSAAMQKKNVAMLKLLLDHGADLSERDNYGNTAFVEVFKNIKCFDNVSFLIQFAKGSTDVLNAQDRDGLTILMCAVRHTSITKELIDCGADVNVRDKNGNTALFCALFDDRHKPEVLNILIDAGSDVNCQNNAGLSPLMVAASRFNKNDLSILLDSGADINAVSGTNNTSTALSCLLNITEFCGEAKSCIQFLLDRGGRFYYVKPACLHILILHGYAEVIPQLMRCGLAAVDISSDRIHFIMLNFTSVFGVSPLSFALIVGNVALAQYFMETMFLTKSDISSVRRNYDLRNLLELMKHHECLHFLKDISKNPFSLVMLSFVAVSSAVGTSPGREKRVNELCLPQTLKDKLLFKSQYARLMVPAPKEVTRGRSLIQAMFCWNERLLLGGDVVMEQVRNYYFA